MQIISASGEGEVVLGFELVTFKVTKGSNFTVVPRHTL
jgi:hypothetical protein